MRWISIKNQNTLRWHFAFSLNTGDRLLNKKIQNKIGKNLLEDRAVSRSDMLADQEAMDTPEIHTIRIVHIHCDMKSILGDKAAKRQREKDFYLFEY